MPRAKKGERFGGRTKGTPNKITADVKKMILAALDKVGGVDYLVEQALKNPTPFMTLVGKVLPLQLEGNPDKPIATTPLTDADRQLLQRYFEKAKK